MTDKEILTLFKDCDFDDLNEDNFNQNVLSRLPAGFRYDYFYGATKLVLIPANRDFVIKMPYKGTNMECCEGANFDIYGNPRSHSYDHCARELILYHEAKNSGVAPILLKNHYVGEVNDEAIYTQKIAQTFDDYYDTPFFFNEYSIHSPKEIEAMKDSYQRSPYRYNQYAERYNAWLVDVHIYYGEKMFAAILDFINNYIEDLHANNIGYANDRPVILDYAGLLI